MIAPLTASDKDYYITNYVQDPVTLAYKQWSQYSDIVYRIVDIGIELGLPPSNGLLQADPYSEVEIASTSIIFSSTNNGPPPTDASRTILIGNFSFASDGQANGTVRKLLRVLSDDSYTGRVFDQPIPLDQVLKTSFSALTSGTSAPAGTDISSQNSSDALPEEFSRYLPLNWQSDPFNPNLVTIDAIAPRIHSISVDKSRISLRFSEAVDLSTLIPSRFSIRVNNEIKLREIDPSSFSLSQDKTVVTFTVLGDVPKSDQPVTLSYSDPNPSINDPTGVIQDLAGNDLGSIAPPKNADTFKSASSVTLLADTYRHLILTGMASIGTGNANANRINGNASANSLQGKTGNDKIQGSSGNDSIMGGGGNDKINGELGNDKLTGGYGADTFRFSSPLNASTNVDRITDFSIAQNDRIQLENTGPGLFTGITATGILAANAFIKGENFTTSDQRIRYEPSSGKLFYDPDGNEASSSILFAKLTPGLAMINSVFDVT